MRTFWILLIAVLIGCGGGGGGGDDTDPIPTCVDPNFDNIIDFGYYWGMSTAYGNHLEDFKDYTNMVYIHVTGDLDNAHLMITEALNAGMRPLIYLDPRNVWLDANWNRLVHIRAGYWQDFKWLMERYSKYFAGFYVFDEPHLYGISIDTQEWILSYYKEAFPDTRTWATYYRYGAGVPKNLDVVSITPEYGDTSAGQYRKKMNIMYGTMYDHQTFAITLDAYSADSSISLPGQEYKGDVINSFADIALCDDRVTGFFIFLYPNFDNHLGVEGMSIVEGDLIRLWDRITEIQLPW